MVDEGIVEGLDEFKVYDGVCDTNDDAVLTEVLNGIIGVFLISEIVVEIFSLVVFSVDEVSLASFPEYEESQFGTITFF